MKGIRCAFLLSLIPVLALPVAAQQVIATVPVGFYAYSAAVNPATNKIYVVNDCTTSPCNFSNGTVSVLDGATNNILSVINVGYGPYYAAVNSVTNKIYVVNRCGNDAYCGSYGTVTVIDGASDTIIATVTVEYSPQSLVVNWITNKIYVANICGDVVSCQGGVGTVSVIDGVTNTVTATVAVGYTPLSAAINTVTNKIYVANVCGKQPNCYSVYPEGTVTVIDGVSNTAQSVNVGVQPIALDVNPVTNKIYVANKCAHDPSCGKSRAIMTVIDGATLATTDVLIGGFFAQELGVNSVTNKIYVLSACSNDPSCQRESYGTVSVVDGVTLTYTSVPAETGGSIAINSVTNKIYVASLCGNDPSCTLSTGTVTVIDGATLAFANLFVGWKPWTLAVNPATNRIYVPNSYGNDPTGDSTGTVSVIDGTPPTALQFVPLSQPCRAVDTRPSQGGMGPIQGGTSQNFAISGEGNCATLPNAGAYSLNVTVVPQATLGYLTIWPAGQTQPVVSTMNSVDGRVKADAAMVPAGTGGAVSIYVTDTTNVIVDVNGYFAPVTGSTLAFYPLAPCRVADTRKSGYPQGLGPPSLTANQERQFPILNATTTCNIPASGVAAYSLNVTVVPSGSLGYLTVWPTGQMRPAVSTLNDVLGRVIANAAIVVAGTGGTISAYPTDNTDLIIDIDGYFAAAGPGGLSLYGVQPCRVLDTRDNYGPPFMGWGVALDVVAEGCGASSLSQAYTFNATVVPVASFGYLTLWPDGTDQPLVSTLNAQDGSVTSNMAIVPAGDQGGVVDGYLSDLGQLILDISSYFAP